MIDEKIISRLKQTFSFETQNDVDEFLELIDQLDTATNPEYLPYLFEFLQDDCDIEGADETIRLAIEDAPAHYFVPSLLKNLTKLYNKAHNQCKYLFWGILNDIEYFDNLKDNIHLDDKETLLKLLDDIYKDKYSLPEHKEAIQELKKLLDDDK